MTDETTQWIVEQVMAGNESAWENLIDKYEGRLTAFVRARLRDRHVVEDVVQETFLGFLRSLPHFDPERELENYLFTIAAHKIRDHLRKEGRHPLSLLEDMATGSQGPREPSSPRRGVSTMAASAERIQNEQQHLGELLHEIINQWIEDGEFQRVMCMELLMVCGWANRDAAEFLDLTEQQVANYKFQMIERLTRNVMKSSDFSSSS